MKRLAIKGLGIMAIVICACIFFSGTIRTIATAKVQLVSAKQGRIEERVELQGYLVFPDTEPVVVEGVTDEKKLMIRNVLVAEGRWVEKGDILFTAEVNDYETVYDSYEDAYYSVQKEDIELRRKYGDVRYSSAETRWIQTYDELLDARMQLGAAKEEFEVAAHLKGIVLVDGKLPEGNIDESIAMPWAQLCEMIEKEKMAETAFMNANRIGIREEIVQYVVESRRIAAELDQIYTAMMDLVMLKNRAASIYAPYSGYIVEVNITEGETYDGSKAAIVMSADGTEGVLRADVSETEKEIDDSVIVELASNGIQVNSNIVGRGVAKDGSEFIDVGISNRDVIQFGGASRLIKTPVEMTIRYRAKKSGTLLPVSAVRGSGNDRYVYLVSEERNALGDVVLKVNKAEVHVIVESDDMVSIEENLGRQSIAYMEDRPISDGVEVMPYVQ